ncbi:MAG TPA: pyridoxine 5'-phosphate synthase, partial [Gammaproteobacteria bacterium]
IEIHTGHYADLPAGPQREAEFKRIVQAMETGVRCGLTVHAGHGLNYQNVLPIAALTPIRELNIGHAIVARALFTGLQAAVREMKTLTLRARSMQA